MALTDPMARPKNNFTLAFSYLELDMIDFSCNECGSHSCNFVHTS